MGVAWILWIAVAIFTSRRIYACFVLVNPNGTLALLTPIGWIAAWQLLGLGLVPFLGVSPWHLLWWIPAGWIVCALIGRVLVLMGFQIF